MSIKNILIFSPFLPNQGWGGGVIVRSLTKNPPSNIKLLWTTFSTKNQNISNANNKISIIDFETKFFRGRGVWHFILWLESFLFYLKYKKLLKTNNIDQLWIVLGSRFDQIYKTYYILKKINIPVHISIHDDPILELEHKRVQNGKCWFKYILQNATTIDVISSRMQQDYKSQFGVKSIVVTRCIASDFPTNKFANPDKPTILMAGYGNAPKPWPIPVLDAVTSLNKNNHFSIQFFDSKLKKYASKDVIVSDLVNEVQFNKILETTAIGYACDSLEPNDLKFAQLSLPTKIVTYIGAGIPFLYHGPKNSTVSDLIDSMKVGLIVDSNNSVDLSNAFLEIIKNYNFFQNNCLQARKEIFAENIICNRFYNHLLQP